MKAQSLTVARLMRRKTSSESFEMANAQHVYEVRPRKDHSGVDLISDVLPFGRLWYGGPNAASNAIDCAKFRSRSHDGVIRHSSISLPLR